MFKYFKILLISFCVIVISFAMASGIVAMITVFVPTFLRFWPLAVTYSIAGVFASGFAFEYAMSFSNKTIAEKWVLILFQIIAGLCCFYFLSRFIAIKWFEMRGLEIVFKAFAAGLALGSLIYIGKNIKKSER